MTTTPKAEPMSDDDLLNEAHPLCFSPYGGTSGKYDLELRDAIINLALKYAAAQRPAVPEGVEQPLEYLCSTDSILTALNVKHAGQSLRAHIEAQGLEIERLRGLLTEALPRLGADHRPNPKGICARIKAALAPAPAEVKS